MKILIIRFSSIGDIVMMTPVIRCIAQQTNYEVHFLTKSVFSDLVQWNPYVKKLHTLEQNDLITQLKQEKFSYCIDLHNNIRSQKISRQLGIKTKRISKLSLRKFVLIHTSLDILPRGLHVAHRALQTVRFLNIKDDHEGMEVFFPKKYTYHSPINKPYITLAIGTAKATKNILKEQLQDIIKKSSLPVLLLGGKGEETSGNAIESEFPNAINLAGKCSILESMKIIQNSTYFIGGDTGLLHIACALKVPTISIWGATIPEFGVFPYYGKYNIPHFIHEVHGLRCRPCSKHGTQKCPKVSYPCMANQSMTDIENSMIQLSK